jgi:hypothetical protein
MLAAGVSRENTGVTHRRTASASPVSYGYQAAESWPVCWLAEAA